MDLFKLFEPKPDHPMATASGAHEALLPLKTEKPLEAAAQLAHWAGTLRDTDGFACDDRLAAVKIEDDLARPIIPLVRVSPARPGARRQDARRY